MNSSISKNSNKQMGITLIALIITIIILLILSGLTLNFVIKDGGIIDKTQKAKQKYKQEEAKEKLEIVLAQLKADKYGDKNYNKNEYIDNKLTNQNMIVIDDVVIVDEWGFEIDREVPKIEKELGKQDFIAIRTSYIGTRGFTTKIEYLNTKDEIEEYIYIVDETEYKTNKQEYTIDKLEPESMHKVKVIAKCKNGKTIQSNLINVKLEPLTYLYKEGEEYFDLTGGWEATTLHGYVGNNPVGVKPIMDKQLYYMKITQPRHNYIAYGSATTGKKIDLQNYKKICLEYTATLGVYSADEVINFGLYNGSNYVIDTAYEEHLCYKKAITEKTIYEVDISNINEELFAHIMLKSTSGQVQVVMYQLWLEK